MTTNFNNNFEEFIDNLIDERLNALKRTNQTYKEM